MRRTHRTRNTESARGTSPRPGRRPATPRWGDQRLDHRIPTFLETLFFEGDTSAITARRFDT